MNTKYLFSFFFLFNFFLVHSQSIILNSGIISPFSVVLHWTSYPQSQGYEIYISGDNSIFTLNKTVVASLTSTQIISLNPNSRYYLKVRSILSNGYSSYSYPIFITTPSLPRTQINVSLANCGVVTLNWSSSQPATSYTISRAENSNIYTAIAEFSRNTFTFLDSNRSIGSNYSYSITANFILGGVPTAILATTPTFTLNCDFLQNIFPGRSGNTEISIQWDDFPSTIVEQGYEVYRSSTEHGEYQLIASLPANTLQHIDNVDFSTRNYYKIKGVFSGFSSTLSKALLHSTGVYTISSGSWDSPSTWSSGLVPLAQDAVWISEGHIITMPDNYTANMWHITNKGNILLGNNSRIDLGN